MSTKSKPLYTIGVDPGVTGAYVCLYNGKWLFGGRFPTYKVTRQLKKGKRIMTLIGTHDLGDQFIYNLIGHSVREQPIVYMETQHGRQKQGSQETIFRNYQALYDTMRLCNKDIQEVFPRTWQKALGIRTNHTKQDSLAFARRETGRDFIIQKPRSQSDDDGMADAFCIAYYAYIMNNI